MDNEKGALVKDRDLYEKMSESIKGMHFEIHAIYQPDGSEIWGDCYCAAVDLFSFAFTFRIYFKITEDGEIDVQNVSRWYFG